MEEGKKTEMREERVLRLYAEASKIARKNCPKCFDRRIIGVEVKTRKHVFCPCFNKALEKARRHIHV